MIRESYAAEKGSEDLIPKSELRRITEGLAAHGTAKVDDLFEETLAAQIIQKAAQP
jgi:hypothetical protein